jgi:glycosyltransferase involved in cell wall biosynthesis
MDRVQITGPLGEMELMRRLQSSQILAVPSSYEGFGIVFLEGMGFGLPAIGTRAGAAAEIITDGQDGFLIEPGDVHALAAHLQSVALDRDRLLAISLAAQKRYQAYPTWEQTEERVYSFLASLT